MTAVEYLIEEMQKRIPTFYAHYVMNMNEVYKQAKEMEKQQTEISDEEIANEAKVWNLEDLISSQNSFICGAKWYREQLKNKQ